MTSTLSTRKAILSKKINKLQDFLNDYQVMINILTDYSSNGNKEELNRIYDEVKQKKIKLEKLKKEVEEALFNYNKAMDDLQQKMPVGNELQQTTEEKSQEAIELIDRAEELNDALPQVEEKVERQHSSNEKANDVNDEAPRTSLPPIPIPKFGGKVWEWETFWGAFNHTVHSRKMDDLIKMNYLMDALQGEAKEFVKHYEVSQETYQVVIEHLKEKYGNQNAVTSQLLHKLRSARLQGSQLHDEENLCETLYAIVTQLKKKGEHVDNLLMQQQILEKFTIETQRYVIRQKQQQQEEGKWTTEEMLKIIKRHITQELEVNYVTGKTQNFLLDYKRDVQATCSNQSLSQRTSVCIYCNRTNHKSMDCRIIKTNYEREKFIRDHRLCFNCGSSEHRLSACKAGPCWICNKRGHHTSFCRQRPSEEKPQKEKITNVETTRQTTAFQRKSAKTSAVNTVRVDANERQESTILHTKTENASGDCILMAQAKASNLNEEKEEVIKIVLDTGADRSFITEALADRLQLQEEERVPLIIETFNGRPKRTECGITKLKLRDIHGEKHEITVAKVKTITQPLKRHNLDQKDKEFLDRYDIKLSLSPDSSIVKPDLLLGCPDSSILLPHKTLPSGLILIESKLGYLIAGNNKEDVDDSNGGTKDSQETYYTLPPDARLDDAENLWRFESSEIQEFLGPEEQERKLQNDMIWQYFQKTIEKRNDGYYVRLPWKNNASTLPDNKGMAIKRLQTTLTRLKNNTAVLQKYHEVIEEQIQQGIIEEVDESKPREGTILHYLPHQAVFTPNKETTKLRIVYDASAHPKMAPSLNDVLYQGPTLLPQITDIMLRFRIGDVAIISDVEKAFLQVRLQPQDRDATRFIWIKDVTKPFSAKNLVIYRFTRVAFGLSCSPFLLAATIKYHLSNYAENPGLAKIFLENTYVDNMIITAKSTREANNIYQESKRMFSDMKMNLREFLSNDKNFMNGTPEEDKSTKLTQKVLGVTWCSEEDNLILSCEYPETRCLTKRSIAEQVASIYDPMGWLLPLTLKGKLFFQSLWTFDYTWDKPLSQEHVNQWRKIEKDLNGFRTYVPRKIAQIGKPVEIILFADASKKCMAACAYLLSDNDVRLLMAKSKLAPLKSNPTIPKLEISAITMAVRLSQSISTAIKSYTPIKQITILSDSEIALSWLRSDKAEKEHGTLVRNRLKEIRRIVEELGIQVQFGYVATHQNAADCATRGLNKTEFTDHIWWKGSPIIREPLNQNYTRLFNLPCENEQNVEVTTVCRISTFTTGEILDWKRFNQLIPAQRTLAYVLRFIKKLLKNVREELRRRIQKNIPEISEATLEKYITAKEYEMALRVMIRNHQATYYPSYSVKILANLNLYQDKYGIMRCKGRIGNASLPFETQQPTLIIPNTPLAETIVNEAHLPYHCGTSQTIANVRKQFWIPRLRHMARKAIRKCIPCQKMNSLPYKYPNMEDLPEVRVKRTRPFKHVGLDYFGPLITKQNESPTKTYGVIMTCTTTRLLHLELVRDMSTYGLLLAMRRFFARRGVPSTITSDNAPSLILADQIFQETTFPAIDDTSLLRTMATQGIQWKTITPYAPWQGAFYERLIKSVKHSLYKVIQNKTPTIEELETILIEIEGMLNNRPLTYQEENPEEFHILRPIDFIQQDIVITYPFKETTDQEDEEYLPPEEAAQLRTRQQVKEALKSSHEIIEQYWRIWSQQYLTSLRETHKIHMDTKRATTAVPSEGSVVLVADPILPRNTWKIARIIKLDVNANGTIRGAHLALPNGRKTRRPINTLIPLEIEENKGHEIQDTREKNKEESPNENPEAEQTTKHYNLRPRKLINPAMIARASMPLTEVTRTQEDPECHSRGAEV